MKTAVVLALLAFVAASVFASESVGSNVAAIMAGDANGFTNKREALAPICSNGVSLNCAGYGSFCFSYPATTAWSCCGCGTGSNGFQCGACPYASQCYRDWSSPTYYRCSSSTPSSSLSPVGIAMICVGIFVFIVIVVVIAIIRRRRSYTTVEYTPGYGATVTTQPYPYYAPPVIVEPAPVIVSDFGYHHHHHHGYHHDSAAVGFSGGYSSDSAAVGFSGGFSSDSAAVGFSSGGGNAAVGFSN